MSVDRTSRVHAVSIIGLSLWCGLVPLRGSGSLQAAPQLNDRSISDAVETARPPTLTVRVDSLREYRVAVRNALEGGASVVRNELKVR